MLEITHRELYELLEYYEIENKCKRKMSEDIRSDISDRMKTNNPYSKFSEEQKLKFATRVGEENGRFIKISNDELLKIGKNLIETNKKLTCKNWIDFAKSHPNTISQGIHCIKKRFNINTWNEFVEKCNDYNHKIKRIENLEGEFDCYDLQVEENNNFAVITKETNNIQNGIIIKNCGDVMKLQIKVNDDGTIIDTKFKTFGCGSAIASSSYATEYIKGKNINEAINITNADIAKYLHLPPVKLHCSMLAEDAIKAAIKDIEKSNFRNNI
jgi:nitrogen fixation NifU-like protein